MAGEWRDVKFSELCDISRGASPRPIQEWISNEGIPWVKIADATSANSRFINRTNEYIRVEGRPKSVSVFPGDLILSNSATPGIPMFMGIEACIHDGWMLLRNFRGLDKLFAYYLLLYERPALIRQGNGSVFTNLKTDILRNHQIRLPDVPEQRAIAHTLGTLDDKIELNRRTNETLETIARAKFKSWFVDFDPVRAKASGEPPESICRRLWLTPDLLALFPDRFVNSELGEIPEEWKTAPLAKLATYLNRGLSPKYVEEGGVLVLNQKCVRGGHVDTSKGRRHDPMQRKVEGRFLEVGDILVNSTGVGTLGRVAQILRINEPTIVDSHITVVRSDTEKVSWNYLGIAIMERQNEIGALGEGSTGQTELSRQRLGSLPILLPPKLLRDHFDACVIECRQRGATNIVQNETLALVRNALLPQLISGELRIPTGVRHE